MKKSLLVVLVAAMAVCVSKAQTELLKNGDFETQGAWHINQWTSTATNPLFIDLTSANFGYSQDLPSAGSGKCFYAYGSVSANASWNQIKEVLWQPVLLHKGVAYKVTGAVKMSGTPPTGGGGIWAEIHFYYKPPVPDTTPGPSESLYAINSWSCPSDVSVNGTFQDSACTYGLGATGHTDTTSLRPYYMPPDSIFAAGADTVTLYFACQFGIATPDANEFEMTVDQFSVMDTTGQSSAIKTVSQSLADLYIYPNPSVANTTARISYSVLGNSDVTMKIYNVLGQDMATVIKQKMSPGNYTVTFSNHLPQGIYFLKLSENGVPTATTRFIVK